jgi:hypothetical protein
MSGEGMSGAGRPESAERAESRVVSAPLGWVRSGRLVFASGASNVTILGDPAMPDLYRARFEGRAPTVGVRGDTVTVRHPTFPSFDWLNYGRERAAEVALNASIPWQIEIRDSASRLTADLSGLELGSLDLTGGASRVDVTLPRPSGVVSVRILGGASNLTIRRPEGVPARVRVEGGSTNLTFDEERFGAVGGEVDLRSPNHDGAADRYDIAVTGGANAVTVGTR